MAVKNKNNLVAKSVSQLRDDTSTITGFDFYGKNFKVKDAKKSVVSAVREDIGKMISVFASMYFPRRVQGLEDYTMSTGRRMAELKKQGRAGFSNVKQPIIRTFVDRLLKGIIKANLSVKASAVNKENKDKVAAVQTAIEWCFATSKAKSKIQDIASSALLNGNGYCKASFNTPEERFKNIENPDSREVIRIDKTYAKFDRVSEFDLFYEPIEQLRGSQRMVLYRTIKPMKNVLKMIEKMDSSITKEHLAEIMRNPQPFSTKDFNKARLAKYHDNLVCGDVLKSMDGALEVAINNDRVEYVEVWTQDTLSICINGYLVADTENPLKDREKWHPFFDAHYTENPGVTVSEGIGILLGDVQKGYDSLFNLLLDQALMAASPMIMLGPGQQLTNDESDVVFKWKPWGFLMNAGPGSVSFLTPPSVDQGVVSILQNMLEMAQFNVAPATYADYNTQSRTAQDSMLRFEGLADTIALFIESMSNMLNDVAQAWLLDMQSKMPEIFELPVFDNKGLVKEWKKIKREDLEGKFIFEWSSDSIRDVNKMLEKKQLPELMQSIAMFGMSDEGKSLTDKRKILQYIADLYGLGENIVLTEEEYNRKNEQMTIESVKVQNTAQALQAEAQKELEERLAPQQQTAPEQQVPVQEDQIPEDALLEMFS